MSSILSSTMSRTKKRAIGAGAVLAVAAGVSATMLAPAQAIPGVQKACAFDVSSNTAVNGWRPVNSVVSVNDGPTSRYILVNFNADAGVDTLAEIRVGYSIDGGPVQIFGAQNFANHTDYWQTRHNMVVMVVPSGTHTIRPYWRISGSVGKNGVMGARCLTAEAYTS